MHKREEMRRTYGSKRTAQDSYRKGAVSVGWIPKGSLAEGDQRPRLHPTELHVLRRGQLVPGDRDRTYAKDLEPAQRTFCGGAAEGRARRLADSGRDHGACP